jgi:uncharacterized protein (DUF2141 family)
MLRFALATLLCLAPAAAATLTIKVDNIDKRGGDLHVALYDQASWPNDDAEPIAGAIVPAIAPETVVTLKDIKPGVYGVKTFQDINCNGKFDQNWIGLPLEPYGFSNDAKPTLFAPSFDRTKFTVKDGANAIVIHLQ